MMDHEGAMEPEALPGLGAGGDTGAHEERNTRASRWSMNETLVLIAAKKKEMEEDRDARLRGRITHDSNKWSLIAHFCNEHGVHRDSSQCKKRWHSLYTEYKKIKDYEREGGSVSYWLMSADKRRESTLAPMFEREVFDRMDSFLSGTTKVVPEPTFDSGAPVLIGVADLENQEQSQGSSMEMGGVRSGAVGGEKNHRASRWTVHETLILIAAKKKETSDENDAPKRGRTVQDSKKWAAIARFCNEQGVKRDSMQCKKRWHNLYTEYKKIRDHERVSGVESYWVMSVEKRRKSKLARMFEREVYDYMDDFLSRTPKVMPGSTFENGRPSSVRDPVPPREPLPEVGENNSAQQGSLMEMGGLGSTAFGTGHARKRQRRRLLSRDDAPDQKLVSVLESNGKAMQAELAADRELRKEQGANLIAVFDKLADGLGQIASAIHNLQK
ncbi:hypothetical protein Mapa_009682 [Marchantia paleacea]|nr:hypothetical protein Mapa_009682 [Marchantia paleacea]